jgi:hypothetical protein
MSGTVISFSFLSYVSYFRDVGAITGIRTQGQCGACWAVCNMIVLFTLKTDYSLTFAADCIGNTL